VNKTNSKDKSGLVIGLLKDGHLDTSMKTIKTHSSSLNGKGFVYKYNVDNLSDYSLDEGSDLEIEVKDSKASFLVNNVLVGTCNLENVD